MQTQPSFSPYSSVSRQQGWTGARRALGAGSADQFESAPPRPLCRSAAEHADQWRHGSAATTGMTFSRHLAKLARQLEVEEQRLREHLCKRAGRVRDGDRAKAPRARATA